MAENIDKNTKIFLNLNLLLCFVLVEVLLSYFFQVLPTKNEQFVKIVAILATVPVLFSGLKSLKNRKISIDLLAGIALAASLIEGQWISAIFINLMVASARAFSEYVKIKSHSAIDALMKLKPVRVKVEREGKITEIPLKEVKKGDKVVIELGETVPVDGRIIKGQASIDQSSLTGESTPLYKKEGDKILSFTTVVSGNLVIEAEKVGKETTFERIIALVEQAQANKSPIYSFIERFTKWYIVATLALAVLVYIFSRDMNFVVAVLLISCADDIAVATPLALMSAITHGAKHGAVIKGGDYLEGLAGLKMIVFDKTGTLTQGKLKIEKVHSFGSSTENDILALATIPSSLSSHPIAHAIVEYAKEKKIFPEEPQDFEEYEGSGMSAAYKGKKILMGKLSFIKEQGVKISREQLEEINKDVARSLNVTLVVYGDNLAGFIDLADRVKPKIKQAMAELRKLGIEKTIMLTGDNQEIAAKVAQEAGVDEFHANLLPAEKLEYLKKYLSKKYKVAMVGDGVNDAPGLALSDVGIVMGAIGSDASIEAADIALMRDDISQIPELVRIGRSTMGVIRQNIMMWGIVNVIGFILVFTHVIGPSGAAAYNFVTDFIPIFNSLRLFK